MRGLAFPLPEASQNAVEVDHAFFTVFAIASTILLILFVLVIVFVVRYRRGSSAERGPLPKILQREIEIGWTMGTTFLAIFIFWWFVGGSGVASRNPPGQLEIHVVAKQWMWKTEHAAGAREIDALHLPVDVPIRLVMTSQDVIHSFYVPAFRLKQDVLPGRDEELSFKPIETGVFHLLCAEFCGTQHSAMVGAITVMTQPDYARWLGAQPQGDTMVRDGEALYAKLGCGACHAATSKVRAPKLVDLYGHRVTLQNGRTAEADDAYLRRAILQPRDDLVAGYEPIMPSYSGLIDTADADALVAYIKSLGSIDR